MHMWSSLIIKWQYCYFACHLKSLQMFFAYSDPYAAIANRKELGQESEEQHDDEQEFIAQNDALDITEEEDENDEDYVSETVISVSASDKEEKKASTKVDFDRQAFGQILMYKVVHN